MSIAARAQAMTASWDAVFESVHAAYEYGLRAGLQAGKKIRMRPEAEMTVRNLIRHQP